jgi:hypothetical protein
VLLPVDLHAAVAVCFGRRRLHDAFAVAETALVRDPPPPTPDSSGVGIPLLPQIGGAPGLRPRARSARLAGKAAGRREEGPAGLQVLLRIRGAHRAGSPRGRGVEALGLRLSGVSPPHWNLGWEGVGLEPGPVRDKNGVVKTPNPGAGGYCPVMIDGKSHLIHSRLEEGEEATLPGCREHGRVANLRVSQRSREGAPAHCKNSSPRVRRGRLTDLGSGEDLRQREAARGQRHVCGRLKRPESIRSSNSRAAPSAVCLGYSHNLICMFNIYPWLEAVSSTHGAPRRIPRLAARMMVR